MIAFGGDSRCLKAFGGEAQQGYRVFKPQPWHPWPDKPIYTPL